MGPPTSAPLLPPNDISIGSAIFEEYIRVTDTQTDRQTMLSATSAVIGHISAMRAMQSNKYEGRSESS